MGKTEKRISLGLTFVGTIFISIILSYATDPEVPYIIHTLIGAMGGMVLGYLTADLN